MNSPNVAAFITALIASNPCAASGERGRKRIDSSSDTTPNGTWMANSHGHDATAMIAAATDGPAAYGSALSQDLAARKGAGAQLRGNSKILFSATARKAIAAGRVDSRLLVAIVAMGLPLLDNADFEDLARQCERLRRWEFFFMLAPLPFTGSTSSAVNPLAIF